MEECAEKQVGAFVTVVKAEECLLILSKGGKKWYSQNNSTIYVSKKKKKSKDMKSTIAPHIPNLLFKKNEGHFQNLWVHYGENSHYRNYENRLLQIMH